MPEGKWRSTEDDLPDWQDSGPAQLRYADGRVVDGAITIDEQWTGEEDIPLAEFRTEAGDRLSIFDAEAWRLKPTTAPSPT